MIKTGNFFIFFLNLNFDFVLLIKKVETKKEICILKVSPIFIFINLFLFLSIFILIYFYFYYILYIY